MTGSCYGLSLQGRGLVIRREGRFLLRVAEDAVTDSGKIRTASSWAAANALDIATISALHSLELFLAGAP